ncbi:MAG TPA: flagellar biosynthetic protein FliR [Candidatus Acidoferrales bacterium]|nr:flagellar biosynthetic protein FliR [Candidatus Acidoferrales bacterium]
MIDFFGVTAPQLETFILVMIRVFGMLAVFPIFSAPQVPQHVRFGFGLLISFILFKVVPPIAALPSMYDLVAAVVAQVVLGVIIGFVASLVFVSFQFAGELIDLQIGFAVANVLNPLTQQNVTIIGELELALATLVFLATDSHHLLIQGIAGSFTLVPLPFISLNPRVMWDAVSFLSLALVDVFKIAAPPAGALFLTNVALAFMARVAPQMNVFVVGFPIQIGVGLTVLALSLSLLGVVGPDMFHDVALQMDTVMRGLRM